MEGKSLQEKQVRFPCDPSEKGRNLKARAAYSDNSSGSSAAKVEASPAATKFLSFLCLKQ